MVIAIGDLLPPPNTFPPSFFLNLPAVLALPLKFITYIDVNSSDKVFLNPSVEIASKPPSASYESYYPIIFKRSLAPSKSPYVTII